MADYNSAYTGAQIDSAVGKLQNALTVDNGGTGATTPAKARENLGLDKVDNTADASKNVASANKLASARKIALTGDVTGAVSFDGSKDVSTAATLADSGVSAGSYGPTTNIAPKPGEGFVVPQIIVDAKGRVTEAYLRTVNLPAAQTSVTGNAGTAARLQSPRDLLVNLASNLAATFDGSDRADIGVTGLLGVLNGGTGADNPDDARRNIGAAGMTLMTESIASIAKGGKIPFQRRPTSSSAWIGKARYRPAIGIVSSDSSYMYIYTFEVSSTNGIVISEINLSLEEDVGTVSSITSIQIYKAGNTVVTGTSMSQFGPFYEMS